MGFGATCDVCGEPIDVTVEHYRALLVHWSDPIGGDGAPAGSVTNTEVELLVHAEHVGENDWFLKKVTADG